MSGKDSEPKVEEVTETTQAKETEEEEMPVLESQPKKEKKLNKAEKKCIKILSKIGMKSLAGVTRVTLKRRDGIVFVISNPEVYRSSTNDNSFVVVGELKMDEPRIDNLPQAPPTAAPTASKVEEVETKASEDKPADSKEEEKKGEPKKDDDDDEELDESGLTPMNIDMVVQNANCTRREAVKALISSNNDMVNAIMLLTK